MQIDLSTKEFRHLLDLVYIGNWILNSTRGDDRFADYDNLESKLFELCRNGKMPRGYTPSGMQHSRASSASCSSLPWSSS